MLKEPITKKLAPKDISQLILPKRIKNLISDGINCNLMFYSDSPGVGKSATAKILLKDYNYKYINASSDGNIDYLREVIQPFCENNSISFKDNNNPKIVYLEELDRSSDKFQDAMKSFMDQFSNVYYLATTNHPSKIDKYVMSRFTKIDFTPQMGDERDEMSSKFNKRMDDIIKLLKMSFDDDSVGKIYRLFPNYRSAYNAIEGIYRSGVKEVTSKDVDSSLHEYMDIYGLIIKSTSDQFSIHTKLMKYAGCEEMIIKSLHTSFIDWIMENKPSLGDKIGNINVILSNCLTQIENSIDPILHLKSCIFKLNMLITKK